MNKNLTPDRGQATLTSVKEELIKEFGDKFIDEEESQYMNGQNYIHEYFNEHLEPKEVRDWLSNALDTIAQATEAEVMDRIWEKIKKGEVELTLHLSPAVATDTNVGTKQAETQECRDMFCDHPHPVRTITSSPKQEEK